MLWIVFRRGNLREFALKKAPSFFQESCCWVCVSILLCFCHHIMCLCKASTDVRFTCQPPALASDELFDERKVDDGRNDWVQGSCETVEEFLECPERVRTFVYSMNSRSMWYQRAKRFDFAFVRALFSPEDSEKVVKEWLESPTFSSSASDELSSAPSSAVDSEPFLLPNSSSESDGVGVAGIIPTKLLPVLRQLYENWNDIGLVLSQMIDRSRTCLECKQSSQVDEGTPPLFTCGRCIYERRRREEREMVKEDLSHGSSSPKSLSSEVSSATN